MLSSKQATIRAHLWLLIAAVLTPVIVIAAIFALSAAGAQRRVLEEQRAELATRLAGTIDRHIAGILGRLAALAASGPLEAGDIEAFRARAGAVMGNNPKVAVVLENVRGDQLLNTLVPTGKATPRRIDTGRIAAVIGGKTVVTGVNPGAVTNNPIVLVSIPAKLKGEAIVLSYGFEASVISGLVFSAEFDPKWIVSIIDRDGRIVAHSRGGTGLVGTFAGPALANAARTIAPQGRLLEMTHGGEAGTGFFRRSELTDWIAAIAIPKRMLEAPFYRSLAQLTLLGVVGLILAILVGAWLGERIGKPVEALAQGAIALGRDAPLPAVPDTVAELTDIAALMRGARDSIAERRRLEQSQAYSAAIVSGSDDAIISKTLDGIVTSWNPGAERIFGYRSDEMIGAPITRIIPTELLHEEEDILRRLRRGERVDHYETMRVAKNGRPVDVSLTVSPVLDPDGRVIGASKISRDITARRQAEAHHRLLSAEVNHRANNLLAVVQSIATQSSRTGDPEAFADALTARIHALAATQRLIVDGDWRGVDLADVARVQLGVVIPDPGQRSRLDGPPMRLSPFAAQMLGMALHELTANALQHGALQSPTGTIEVIWQTIGEGEEAKLRLAWTEYGAPETARPDASTRQGFGTRVAVALEHALSGRVHIDYRPHGLSWVLCAPLSGPEGIHLTPGKWSESTTSK